MSDDKAGPGEVFVCFACGKTSPSRYGFDAGNGWDSSCMSNAVLCDKTSLVLGGDGRAVRAIAVVTPEGT